MAIAVPTVSICPGRTMIAMAMRGAAPTASTSILPGMFAAALSVDKSQMQCRLSSRAKMCSRMLVYD